tara:strand:- start:24 stop:191 length:168 start_codon:yes stop_codon:yes gene_type:complete
MSDYTFTNKITKNVFHFEADSNFKARQKLHELMVSVGLTELEAIAAQQQYRGKKD